MKRRTETQLVSACLDMLAIHGIFAWRNNTTGVYDPTRSRFRRFTGMKGVSDILGVMNGGRLLAVECKHGWGTLTKEQRAFLSAVADRGGLAMVVRSVDELIEGLKEAKRDKA